MDEYTGIFDNISPADFILTKTTAIFETPRTTQPVDAFSSFVEEQKRTLTTAFMASEGHLQPIAVLANSDTQRVFTPDDEENVAEFIKRLNREARQMAAVWTFYAQTTLVRSQQVDPDSDAVNIDPNDPDDVALAMEKGELVPGVFWYSERREGDEQHRRQGVMAEEGPGKLGPPSEASPLQSVGIFSLILN